MFSTSQELHARSNKLKACIYCTDNYSVLKIDESYVKNEEVRGIHKQR